MKETIVEKLTNIVINKFGKEYAPLIEVSRVTKPHIDADFYSNIAMKLAKSLKQNPGNIAKDITEAIVDLDGISVSVAKPGYINFQINKNLKNNSVYEIAMTDDLLASFKVDNPKKFTLNLYLQILLVLFMWVMVEELYLGMSLKNSLKSKVMMFIANIM